MMHVTLRPAQAMALPAALKGLRSSSKRALVVLATALGKTYLSAKIGEEYGAKRILFLAHNTQILKKAMRDDFPNVFYAPDIRMALYTGLAKKGAEEAHIVFATWQTMNKRLMKWARDHFDLIIVDEAHHAEAETYRPVVEYFTGARLGMTATPDREDEGDIRDLFGPEVIDISLEEAIARGWLPRIEYHVITDEGLDEKKLQQIAAEIREGKKRFTMAEVNRRLFIHKRDEEIARIIDSYIEKAAVFCASIPHANRMSGWLSSSAVFHSKSGRYQKETEERNSQTIEALKEGLVRRVCTVNAFNEGIDVPSLELVAFCRATESGTIFRQQLGRGMRPGKEKLIVLDFVGNLERIQRVRELMDRVSDLHEEFTSEEERTREGYSRKPFEVSGKGFEFTFSKQVVDLMMILEHVEREFYGTWQEAAESAKRLGAKTQSEYFASYKKDPRLPSQPAEFYAPNFPGWAVFLGRKSIDYSPYKTVLEAAKAARALDIGSSREYERRYKEDPRLPAKPRLFYPDFTSWSKFLDEDSEDPYQTCAQAMEAVRRLKINSIRGYRKRWQEDPRLRGEPGAWYKDWPGWLVFLGKKPAGKESFYASCDLASKVAVKLGIKSVGEYATRYVEDPQLCASPSQFYGEAFPGWKVFLGGKKKDPYKTVAEASKAAQALGIGSPREYRKNYKKDARLPVTPEVKYKNDFPGWPKFLGKEK